jgi:hypothetical protein
MPDTITVAIGNLEHDGGPGRRPSAWYDWHDYVAETVRPDLLLRQECTHSHADGGNRLHQAEDLLGGMRGYLAPATPESPNPVGVFVNPDKITVRHVYPQVTGFWHPAMVLGIGFYGVDTGDTTLWAASWHLCGFDPGTRAFETRRMGHFTRPGHVLIGGGDCNSYPVHTPAEHQELPDWSTTRDRTHHVNRSWRLDESSDTVPDRVLTALGMKDAARWHAEHGHLDATRPTASLHKGTNERQGPRQRIDRLYLTDVIAPAIVDVTVHDSEQVAEWTDHALVSVTLSTAVLGDLLAAA